MYIALFPYLDECCQLSSQLIIPDIGLSLPARGIASPILFNQLPLQVNYLGFNFLKWCHNCLF